MASFDRIADQAVRDAVDAYIEGRLVPDFSGETVFETKNSRYRLLDGVIFAAPDTSLLGAELVGWLVESSRRSVVESAWAPGSRAILVDRGQGRSIIVTSTTRLLHLDDSGSDSYRPGFAAPHPPHATPPARSSPIPPATMGGAPCYPPAQPAPPFSPHSAPIIPSTPPPPFVDIPAPRAPRTDAPSPPSAHTAMNPSPAHDPRPIRPSPIPPAKRVPAVHLPPRPIARPVTTGGAPPYPQAHPAAPIPATPLAQALLRSPPVPSSAEFDWEPDTDVDTDEMETRPNRAGHQHASVDSPDSMGAPIPLIRAISPTPAPKATSRRNHR